MFRREVKSISDLLNMYLRREGLETPLLQKRAIDAGQYNGRNDNKIYWREVYQEPNLVCENHQSGFASGPLHDAHTHCAAHKPGCRKSGYNRCQSVLGIVCVTKNIPQRQLTFGEYLVYLQL